MKQLLRRLANPPSTDEYTARLLEGKLLSEAVGQESACRTALDLGAGVRSPLSKHSDRLNLIGIDASQKVVDEARRAGNHSQFIKGDLTNLDPAQVGRETGVEKFDLVALYDVIEHLPRTEGLRVLDSIENLTSRFILVETPNGFRAQGPEYGNPHQRHLSGWFIQDFEARGYTVFGNNGTRYIRDYAGAPKVEFPFWNYVDFALATLLRVRTNPRHAYSLMAVKDVRGVPARGMKQ